MAKPRTRIHVEQVVWDLPIEQVWSLVSSFGSIKAWMPSIRWCTIDGHGVGATRTVMAFVGVAHETLEVLDDKEHHISYRIQDWNPSPLPAKGGFGTWKLESKGENSTQITWIADAEQVEVESIPEIQKVYEPFMKECLAGLKKALA